MTALLRSFEQLKKDAKRLKREHGVSHAEALRRVAVHHGFVSWEDLLAQKTNEPDTNNPSDQHAFAGLLNILGDLRGTDAFALEKTALTVFQEKFLSRFRDATNFIPTLITSNGWLGQNDLVFQIEPPRFAPMWLGRWEVLPAGFLRKAARISPVHESMATVFASPRVYLDLLAEAHYANGTQGPAHLELALRCLHNADMELLDQALALFGKEFTAICQRAGTLVVRALEDPDIEHQSPKSVSRAVHSVSRGLLRKLKGDPDRIPGGLGVELTITAQADPVHALNALESFLVVFATIERAFASPPKKTGVRRKPSQR